MRRECLHSGRRPTPFKSCFLGDAASRMALNAHLLLFDVLHIDFVWVLE